MWPKYIVLFWLFIFLSIFVINEANVLATQCPMSCSCQKAPFKELAISRWIKETELTSSASLYENDDNDDNLDQQDNTEIQIDYENEEETDHLPHVGSVTCILGSQNIKELLHKIPRDTQALTLIQPTKINEPNSNDSVLRTSWLNELNDLRALQVNGNDGSLTFHTDEPLEDLLYLRLEGTRLLGNGFSGPLEVPIDEPKLGTDETPTITYGFEEPEEEIVPYEEYVKTQRERNKNDDPLITFYGWSSLQVLQIHDCALFDVQRDMFNGLKRLRRLSLERNGLRFIPDHAFHGCPHLRSLSLARNDILNLFYRGLAGLTKLKRLDLSHNNLTRLSERTFAPFPNLKEVDIRESPIKEVFPNTFGVMNATRFLALGSTDQALELTPGGFINLGLLETLLAFNIKVQEVTSEIFIGLNSLKSLTMTGDLMTLQYDAFSNSPNLRELILSNCKIQTISMDAFVGVPYLAKLDLSVNQLRELPPGLFDPLVSLRELYLQDNHIISLPQLIFSKIKPKLIRLNNNPWHCTCTMSDWNAMITSKVKRLAKRTCRFIADEGFKCDKESFEYVYDNKMAPRCESPLRFKDWNVFHALRKQTHCWSDSKHIKNLDKKLYLKNKHKLLNASKPHMNIINNIPDTANNIRFNQFSKKHMPYIDDEINELSPLTHEKSDTPFKPKKSKAQKLFNTKLQRLANKLKYEKPKKTSDL